MSTPRKSRKKISDTMKRAVRRVKGVVTPEKLFLDLLKRGPHSALWGILLRLNLKIDVILEDFNTFAEAQAKKINPQEEKDKSPKLHSILEVAWEIAKDNEEPHKNCLGVREFLLACIRHRNNHVRRILYNHGLNLEDIIKKACKF
jgi:ATP-dependent Clp protease ATP-binding subunit ClpA